MLKSLKQALEHLRAGETSPEQLVTGCLDRIETLNGVLNAFVTIDAERALEHARQMAASGASEAGSPFRGVPLAIKDLAETAGLRTTYSSRAFREHVPTRDAPIVDRLRNTGFIFVGKTNTSEFGILPVTESELNGVCPNPWDVALTSGGSSGGAAVSVATSMVPVAHGSDGGGSLRIPAACCGVVGVMPGRGRLPGTPRPSLGDGAQHGVISRTTEDAVCFLEGTGALGTGEVSVATGQEAQGRPPRIAVTWTPPVPCDVHPDCIEGTRLAESLLANSGCEVSQVTPNWESESIAADARLLRSTIPVSFGDRDPTTLDQTTVRSLEVSMSASALDLHRAIARLTTYARRALGIFADYDILVTPTLAMLPVPNGWVTEDTDPEATFDRAARFTPFTMLANLGGLAAASLPLHWTASGLPVGVQLLAPASRLAMLLGLSSRLEALRPWKHRVPPLEGLRA